MENIIFKCNFCGREFKTRNSCNSHSGKCKQNPNYKVKPKSEKWYAAMLEQKGRCCEPFIECECKFCKRTFNKKSSKTIHERSCKLNPDRVKGHTTILSEEAKNKISASMKKAHKEGRAGTFPSRKNCEHSWPEKWIIGVLNRELGLIEGKDYKTEYYFHKQFLDFAWPDKKLCIEVDGEQHKRFQDRIEADKRKNENLESEGWSLLRLDWSYICNNTQDVIKQILDFLK